jgi:hypothetical protein
MKNPIPRNDMWATPDSLEDLHEILERFNGSEASVAWHVALLTLNLCNKLVADQLKQEETI